MSCLIPLIAGACLLDPTHVTIRADSHWLVTHRDFYYWTDRAGRYDGPVARVEMTAGGDLNRSVRLYYGVGHQSFLNTVHDSGYEYVVAGIEWHPFRSGN